MYADDISDKESEFDELNLDESPNVTKNSLSTVGFRSSHPSDCTRPIGLRTAKSFTGAVEELKLYGKFKRLDINKTNTAPSPKVLTVCPCGCFLRPAVTVPFRTREKNTLALHVVPPEALLHHGNKYEPKQIAMFWKKDCRMFLWKGKSKMKEVIHAESYKK